MFMLAKADFLDRLSALIGRRQRRGECLNPKG